MAKFVLDTLHDGSFTVPTLICSLIFLSRLKEKTGAPFHRETWRLLWLLSLLYSDKVPAKSTLFQCSGCSSLSSSMTSLFFHCTKTILLLWAERIASICRGFQVFEDRPVRNSLVSALFPIVSLGELNNLEMYVVFVLK